VSAGAGLPAEDEVCPIDGLPGARQKGTQISQRLRMLQRRSMLRTILAKPASFPGPGDAQALQKVPFVVSLSSFPDETNGHAHLVLPANTFLESWGNIARAKTSGTAAACHGSCIRHPPSWRYFDLLGKKIDEKRFPWKNFYALLRESWREKGRESFSFARSPLGGEHAAGRLMDSKGPEPAQVSFKPLNFSLPRHGVLADRAKKALIWSPIPPSSSRRARSQPPIFAGVADPVTQITWGGWVEINPGMAEKQGIQKGDILILRSAAGTLKAPAFPLSGDPGGHTGHTHRPGDSNFAGMQKANQGILPRSSPPGSIRHRRDDRALSGVTIEKEGHSDPPAHTDGSAYQHGRIYPGRSLGSNTGMENKGPEAPGYSPSSRGIYEKR